MVLVCQDAVSSKDELAWRAALYMVSRVKVHFCIFLKRRTLFFFTFVVQAYFLFGTLFFYCNVIVSALSNVPLCHQAVLWQTRERKADSEREIAHWSVNVPNGAFFLPTTGLH